MFKIYSIILLIGISIGICITYFWGSEFNLGQELNIVDILSVLATLFLAFYIPTVLEKNRDSRRFEREVLIKRVDSLSNHFEYISKLVSESDISQPLPKEVKNNIVSTFTRISNELKVLFDLLTAVKLKKKIKNKGNHINDLRRNYKGLVTGGRFDTPSFSYSPSNKIAESLAIVEITKQLSLLVLEINSLD